MLDAHAALHAAHRDAEPRAWRQRAQPLCPQWHAPLTRSGHETVCLRAPNVSSAAERCAAHKQPRHAARKRHHAAGLASSPATASAHRGGGALPISIPIALAQLVPRSLFWSWSARGGSHCRLGCSAAWTSAGRALMPRRSTLNQRRALRPTNTRRRPSWAPWKMQAPRAVRPVGCRAWGHRDTRLVGEAYYTAPCSRRGAPS